MALVLTRRLGESLNIGEIVNVTIVKIKGDQVRLAIEAPPQVEIHRQEVYLSIKAERDALKKAAAATPSR